MPAVKTAESAPDQLEFYRVRDDLAHTHNPANAYELMLVTQMAQAWLRLQRAYDTEKLYFESHDIMETIATKLNEFKTVTRFVTDCDRAWRHAKQNLETCQRRRLKGNVPSPNRRLTTQHASRSMPFRAAYSPNVPADPGPTPAAMQSRE
jgi:hypothetical protein